MEKVTELKNNYNLGDYGEYICDYNDGYICDIFTYIADDVDIYYNDLIEWLKHGRNECYVEDAVKEGLVDVQNFDLFKAIQCGQFFEREQNLYENLEDIVKFRLFDYIVHELKIEELTEEQAEEIDNLTIDNNDRLEDLFEQVNELLGIEQEEA